MSVSFTPQTVKSIGDNKLPPVIREGRGVYNVEPKALDEKRVYKNFDTPFSETERNILNLRFRDEGWDGDEAPKPNRDSIAHAHQWAMSLYRDVRAGLWIKPRVSSDEDGDVTFEWWKERRKLTVYVSPETAEYVQVEKGDTALSMKDGSIDTHEKRRALWCWLTAN
jgi:hypothetical protein